MKNLLSPKPNRLLIQFRESIHFPQRVESFRTTSVEKAQKIINKRNPEYIEHAAFGKGFMEAVKTDKKLQLVVKANLY